MAAVVIVTFNTHLQLSITGVEDCSSVGLEEYCLIPDHRLATDGASDSELQQPLLKLRGHHSWLSYMKVCNARLYE